MSDTDTSERPRRVPMVPGPRAGLTNAAPQPIDKMRRPAEPPLSEVAPFYRVPGPHGKLAGAMAKVMAEVGTVKKTGHNSFHHYDYMKMEDLLNALTPLLGKHGLAVFQSEVEVKMIEQNRVAVTYEFTVAHESNEAWPPQRHTAMAMARDSKGNFDDKCLNKAHTAARKYFLCSLFNVPAGDFPDADEDETPGRDKKPIPGPSAKQETKPAPREATVPEEPIAPQKIGMGAGAGVDAWAKRYIEMIGKSVSGKQIAEWDKLNDAILQKISDEYADIYGMINAAVQRRLTDLGQAMPSPKGDLQAAMNWVAQNLQDFVDYKAAEAWWNLMVAPREKEFDPQDFDLLLREYSRMEARLAPETATNTEQ